MILSDAYDENTGINIKNVGSNETKSMIPHLLVMYLHGLGCTANLRMYSIEKSPVKIHSIICNSYPATDLHSGTLSIRTASTENTIKINKMTSKSFPAFVPVPNMMINNFSLMSFVLSLNHTVLTNIDYIIKSGDIKKRAAKLTLF